MVAAAFVVMMVMWGTYYTFGVFFEPLSTDLGWTRAMTAGAFSLYVVIHGILGIVAGGFTDRHGPRLVVGICALFLCVGYLLLSRIGAIWQLYLFYGILIGVGMSGAWIPQVATVARWFIAKRGMAIGIVTAGVGVGQLVFPLLTRHIISTANWRMGYFVIGIIALVFVGLACLFLRRDPQQLGLSPYGVEQIKQAVEKNHIDEIGWTLPQAARTKLFGMFGVMYFLYGLGYIIPFVHIVAHATDIGISPMAAAGILSVIGIGSIIGRLAMGAISDKIGRRMTLSICLALVAVSILWLLLANKIWMFYLFGVVFGFFYGGANSSLPSLCEELFGLKSLGLIYGTLVLFCTIGSAISAPLAGHLFDITGSYQLAFLIGGLAILIATAITFLFLKPPRLEYLG